MAFVSTASTLKFHSGGSQVCKLEPALPRARGQHQWMVHALLSDLQARGLSFAMPCSPVVCGVVHGYISPRRLKLTRWAPCVCSSHDCNDASDFLEWKTCKAMFKLRLGNSNQDGHMRIVEHSNSSPSTMPFSHVQLVCLADLFVIWWSFMDPHGSTIDRIRPQLTGTMAVMKHI